MNRITVIVAACFLLAAGMPVAGQSGQDADRIEGDGMLRCVLQAPLTEIGCAPFEGNDFWQYLETGEQEKVTFRLEWDAVSPDAEELEAIIIGNTTCPDTTDGTCYRDFARGPSPIEISLQGIAASNTTLEVQIGTTLDCLAVFVCDPPVKVVRDQPYEFTWILE